MLEPDETPAPTEAEVLAVVARLHGKDGEKAASHRRLTEWGDAALPALRALVARNDHGLGGTTLAYAIGLLKSEASTALLVELLDGSPAVGPSEAFMSLATPLLFGGQSTRAGWLRSNPRLKPALIAALVGGTPWHALPQLAQVVAAEGWSDAVPPLRDLLRHHQAIVRRAAAEALESLTGEQVEFDRPALEVTGRVPVPGLFGVQRSMVLETASGDRCRPLGVTSAPGGSTAFACAAEGCVAWLDVTGREIARVAIPADAGGHPRRAMRVLGIADAATPVRALVTVTSRGVPVGVSMRLEALDGDGRTLWSYVPDPSRIAAVATVHGPAGDSGIAVGLGGDLGVVGLDFDGARTWSVPKQYVVYELHSHPSLPGLVLQIGGDPYLRSIERGRVARTTTTLPYGGVYASKGLLHPDASGEPAVLVCGGDMASGGESLARYDAAFEERWRVRLPAEVAGLASLEPRGHGPLAGVLLEDGRLLAIDDDGRLRAECRVEVPPAPTGAPPTWVTRFSGLSSGRSADGRLFVAALGWGGVCVVPVDESALGRS